MMRRPPKPVTRTNRPKTINALDRIVMSYLGDGVIKEVGDRRELVIYTGLALDERPGHVGKLIEMSEDD